jgi:hypothetical protein
MKSDPLRRTAQDMIRYAREAGLVLFYAVLGDGEHDLLWINEQGGSWEEFIKVAVEAGAKVLYMSWAPFEEFQVDEALEAARRRAESSESFDPELEKKIERFRDRVGLVALIELGFYLGGIRHVYRLTPEWFDAFEDLVSAVEEDEEEEDEESEEVDMGVVRQWATTLASHPRFGRCKTYGQRKYLLETLAGGAYEKLPVEDIVSRAEAIYAVDILPGEEERLRGEIRRLREKGLPLSVIAVKLGISRDRARALSVEEDES